MRLRRKPWIDEAIHEYSDFVFPKDAPVDVAVKGRWNEIFCRTAPLSVELGTGKGDFLTALATRHPEENFLGIEMQQGVLYLAAKKVDAQGLKNIRLAVFDIQHIEEIFAAGEIQRIYLNFCDPWPKKRHAKRRLTHRDFLSRYQKLLVSNGQLHFKTDNRPLFDFSLEEFRSMGLEISELSFDLHAECFPENIETEYERKFSALGEKINRCVVTFP